MKTQKAHWTERSIKDFLFHIVSDFFAQLENKMESGNISQDKLAKKMNLTKGRISQVLNHPGNITLGNIVKLARAMDMKVSIVAYEDNDPENKKGPINSEIFKISWEKSGSPRDFWAVAEIGKSTEAANKAAITAFSIPPRERAVPNMSDILSRFFKEEQPQEAQPREEDYPFVGIGGSESPQYSMLRDRKRVPVKIREYQSPNIQGVSL